MYAVLGISDFKTQKCFLNYEYALRLWKNLWKWQKSYSGCLLHGMCSFNSYFKKSEAYKAECEDLLKVKWYMKDYYFILFSISLKYIINIKDS